MELGKADYSERDTGRIPGKLLNGLDPDLQDALDHPIRREILRNLGRSQGGRRVSDLAADLPRLGLSQVSYHLRVLAGSGVVGLADSDGPVGGQTVYVVAALDHPQAQAVLDATQDGDEEMRGKPAAGSADDLRCKEGQ